MPSLTISAAILGAGALTAGAGVTGSVLSADAQKSAAQTAANTQLSIFGQTQANLAPYNQAGQSALSQLASLFGLGPGGSGPTNATASAATSALTNYPGYKFGLQQGNLAQQQSAASQGTLLSGAQLQAAQQYGQNYAMQNAWSPYVSQLDTLANQGENAAATTGQVGATTGTSVANSQLAAGQATASGIAAPMASVSLRSGRCSGAAGRAAQPLNPAGPASSTPSIRLNAARSSGPPVSVSPSASISSAPPSGKANPPATGASS